MAKQREPAVLAVAGRRYWREADARVVVDAWRESGEGLSVFAKRHGITVQRLGRWSAWLTTRPRQRMRFHPVQVVGRPASTPRMDDRPEEKIEVVLGDGRLVRVPRGFAPADLHRVLEVLDGRPAPTVVAPEA